MKGKMARFLSGAVIATMLASVPAVVSAKDEKGFGKAKAPTESIAKNSPVPDRRSPDLKAPELGNYAEYLTRDAKWIREIDEGFSLYADAEGKICGLFKQDGIESVKLQDALDKVGFSGSQNDMRVLAVEKGKSYFIIPEGAKACISVVDQPDEGFTNTHAIVTIPTENGKPVEGYTVGTKQDIKVGNPDGGTDGLLIVDEKYAYISTSDTDGVIPVSLHRVLDKEKVKSGGKIEDFKDLQIKAYGTYLNYNEETKKNEIWHFVEVKNNFDDRAEIYGFMYNGMEDGGIVNITYAWND